MNKTQIEPEQPLDGAMFKMLHNTPKLKASKVKAKRHRVKIHDDVFEPSTLKIERGESVEWTLYFKIEPNQDSKLRHNKSRPHVVTFDSLPEESGLMRTITDSFKVKFEEIGVFTYKCSMNVRMFGRIEVVEPAKELNVQVMK